MGAFQTQRLDVIPVCASYVNRCVKDTCSYLHSSFRVLNSIQLEIVRSALCQELFASVTRICLGSKKTTELQITQRWHAELAVASTHWSAFSFARDFKNLMELSTKSAVTLRKYCGHVPACRAVTHTSDQRIGSSVNHVAKIWGMKIERSRDESQRRQVRARTCRIH